MYYVYLLENMKNDETYIGSTNDLKRRLREHNIGLITSTRRYMPWRLVMYEAYQSEKDAREREQKLKSHGNAVKELKKRASRSFKKRVGVYPAPFLKSFTNGAGFTLIETLVYLGLFSILIGGALVAAFGIFESNGRNQTKAMVQEEGQFLAAKIDWVLSGVRSVDAPPASSPGSLLSVTKYGGGTVEVSLAGTDMRIQRNAGPVRTLNKIGRA